MKNFYQIFNNWEAHQINVLKSNGINVPLGFQNITLEDGDLFKKLKPLLDQWGAMITLGSEFYNDDYLNAKHLMILSNWQTQYPQPENDFAYLKETYDLKNYCFICGSGAIQKNPFRIKKDIKWGRKTSFILNWKFDEIFIREDIYIKLFLPIGIDSYPVLLHKNGREINGVKQLKIEKITSRLNLDNRKFDICGGCGHQIYRPITNGYFPDFEDNLNVPNIIKSSEYYGSGKSASNWIIVSKEFRKILLGEEVNFTYYPCDK